MPPRPLVVVFVYPVSSKSVSGFTEQAVVVMVGRVTSDSSEAHGSLGADGVAEATG